MKKILIIIGQLDKGGAENHILNIISSIDSEDIKINIFCMRRGGVLEDRIRNKGVNIYTPSFKIRGLFGLMNSTFSLLLTLKEYKPDIVHYFLPEAYLLGGVVTSLVGNYKKVMSRRSLNNYQSKYLFYKLVERWLHGKLDLALGNSEAVIKELVEEGIDVNKISLIYNGVDIKKYELNISKNSAKEHFNIPSHAFTIVMVANLIHYKGHKKLIETLAEIKSLLPENWIIMFAGRDDGIGDELKKLAELSGVTGHIKWLGEIENIPVLLKSADMAIINSSEEGFSNSILECMASSLPMVATNVGGNPEAVVDEETGIIVPYGDNVLLGNAIVRLASNEELRMKMGESAKVRVMQLFNEIETISQYIDVYKKLLVNT